MRHPGWLPENKEWIRKHVLDNPGASVDDIARAANNARRGVPRGMVAEVRREALEAIETGGVKPPVVVRPRPPFNPPRLAAVAFGTPKPAGPEREDTPTVQGKRWHPETMEARKKFVDDYALAHPAATFGAMRDAVVKQFGHGAPPEYMMAALKAVRETTGVLPKGTRNKGNYTLPLATPAVVEAPPVPVPASAPARDGEVADIARQLIPYMRVHGLNKACLVVEIDAEGSASADWTLERLEKTQGKASL